MLNGVEEMLQKRFVFAQSITHVHRFFWHDAVIIEDKIIKQDSQFEFDLSQNCSLAVLGGFLVAL